MQQGGGGGSQYGTSPAPVPEMTNPFTATTASSTTTTPRTTYPQSQQQQQLLRSSDSHTPMVVEAASPISSRPPPTSSASFSVVARPSFEEIVPAAGNSGFVDEEGFGGDEGLDRGGVGGGNRWPRQETMALLKIRSEMDAAFRDATLKGPLWEDVSRKLAQQGYTRSAKKCKEKFENVHKYYKRTKEGRAGRQDGKSYRFFSQLEALHTTTAPTTSLSTPIPTAAAVTTTTTLAATSTPNPAPTAPLVSIGIGMVGSSGRAPQVAPSDPPIPVPAPASASISTVAATPQIGVPPRLNLPDLSGGLPFGLPGVSAEPVGATVGISFSSNTSSSCSEDEEDDLMEEGPSNTNTSRKRKRESSGASIGSSRKMMDFFERLMKQVMEKQDAMQQRFLETIEKREQDRMIREEAWKRQEMVRLGREHEIMAQERAISASRDAAIIAFLQKLTGQTIQFPSPVVIPAAPPPQATPPQPQHQQPPPPPAPAPPPQQQQQQQQQQPPPPPLQQHPQPQHQQPPPPPQPHQQQQHLHHLPHSPQAKQHHPPPHSTEIVRHQPTSTDIVLAAVPEQQHPPQEMIGGSGGSFDSTSSRWPKQEVLALIKLRSGLESRYQEAGPKGPLWEEISTGMQRMGYNRSSKRCKEKWENINKYFKKVKESNKKRPEDAKTCPYFHQLDALYRKKMLMGLGGGSSGGASSFVQESKQEDSMAIDASPPPSNFQAIMPQPPLPQPSQAPEGENKNSNKSAGNMEEQQSIKEGLFGEGNSGGASEATLKKPEDMMKELIEQHRQQQQQQQQHLVMDDYDKLEEEPDSDNLDQDDDDEYDDDDDEEESKMAYKIQFQRQNAGGSSSNGGGNAPNSFLAMVQ